MLELKEIHAAIAEYRIATALEPNFIIAHFFLAEALQRNEDFAGAVAEFRECTRLSPNNADCRWSLAEALESLGDLDAVSYHEARKLAPKDLDIADRYRLLPPEMKGRVKRLARES